MINHRCSEAPLGAPCVAWGVLRAIPGCVALRAVVHEELGSLLAMVHATHLDVPLPHQVGFAAQEPRGGPGKGRSVQSWSRLSGKSWVPSREVISCFPSRNGHACTLPAAASAKFSRAGHRGSPLTPRGKSGRRRKAWPLRE